MQTPQISVIIPLYNKEPIIGHTLQSVFSQSFKNYEVIVVDDGSTDDSAAVVESFHDERIHLIRQENGGPSKARNAGTRAARGEWVVYLDADDEFLPDALAIFHNAIEKNGNYNFFAFPYFNDNGRGQKIVDLTIDKPLKNPYKDFFFGEIAPRMGSFICNRRLALKCLFNEKIWRFEDDEMLLRMYKHAKCLYISKPVMVANQVYASASHRRKDISEDFLGHLDFKGKTFWEKMCLYKMFLGERPNYPEQCRELYPQLYYRYDLLLLYKIIMRIKAII